jgi:hypothetical protein
MKVALSFGAVKRIWLHAHLAASTLSKRFLNMLTVETLPKYADCRNAS